MLEQGKHVDYRLSRFMVSKQVEELLIVRIALEQACGNLVHIEISLLGSQIEFRALTGYLLAEITRGKYLLVDVDRTDVIEIFKAKNINITVKAINNNKLVLNCKHCIALGVRVNDIISYVAPFES